MVTNASMSIINTKDVLSADAGEVGCDNKRILIVLFNLSFNGPSLGLICAFFDHIYESWLRRGLSR